MCRDNSQVITKPDYQGLEDEFTLRYGHEEYEYENQYCASAYDHPLQAVITAEHELTKMRWGLMPGWCKDWDTALKISNQTINAVGETIETKASFRGAIKHGRFCLIPVSGFFEYHHLGKQIYPFYIYPKTERLFLLGGIYEHWTNEASKEQFNTFSIVTTAANPRMAWIHNAKDKQRMPLILAVKDAHIWLDKEVSFEEKKKLIVPYDEELMADYSVGHYTKWTRDRRESPEVLKPVEYPELALAG